MEPADLNQISREINRLGFDRWFLKALTDSFTEARKGKLKTHDEHTFELYWMENILRLETSILEGYYKPSSSVAFVIFDPMVREIFAAPFRDRIVHHFLYKMQSGWWDRRFIDDSYSCRVNKGTLYGIKRAQKMMQSITNNFHEEAYIVKLDIRGYFMSLKRSALFERVKWGLDMQFKDYQSDPGLHKLYKICVFLWKKVLYDDPVSKAWKRGSLNNWDPSILPPEKSLFTQPPNQGIVIGNLTSQLVSNIYLDKLDRFIKYDLGYQYYGRYVDDFFYMVKKSEYEKAKRDVKKIETFLKTEMDLTLHPKKRHFTNVNQGMEFLGARVYPHCLYPSDRLQNHFLNCVEELSHGLSNIESITSYLGMMKHLNAKNFIKRIFDELGWDYDEPIKG